MSYIAYHTQTTRYLRNHPGVKTDHESFVSTGAAKAAITREAKAGHINAADFAVLERSEFDKIEKTVTVDKHGNGSPVLIPYEISVNTPYSCDPRSERYWSM